MSQTNQQNLPPKIRGLTPDQIQATAEFVRNHPQEENEAVVLRETQKVSDLAPNNDSVTLDVQGRVSETKPKEMPLDVGDENFATVQGQAEEFNPDDALLNQIQGANASQMLESVLNLSQQNKDKNSKSL